jgi:hypothetical protein
VRPPLYVPERPLYVGQKVEHITLKERTTGRRAFWLCACDCGVQTKVREDTIHAGRVTSCGHVQRSTARALINKIDRFTHGMSNTREYESYHDMHKRCEKVSNVAYHNYGGRGITVCDRWSTFEAFYEDMGPFGYSIERVDNEKGYLPTNCKWATKAEQMANRRCTLMLTSHHGITLTLVDWAIVSGIPYATIRRRLERGLKSERVLSHAYQR